MKCKQKRVDRWVIIGLINWLVDLGSSAIVHAAIGLYKINATQNNHLNEICDLSDSESSYGYIPQHSGHPSIHLSQGLWKKYPIFYTAFKDEHGVSHVALRVGRGDIIPRVAAMTEKAVSWLYT